jgi:hypothetical protein
MMHRGACQYNPRSDGSIVLSDRFESWGLTLGPVLCQGQEAPGQHRQLDPGRQGQRLRSDLTLWRTLLIVHPSQEV